MTIAAVPATKRGAAPCLCRRVLAGEAQRRHVGAAVAQVRPDIVGGEPKRIVEHLGLAREFARARPLVRGQAVHRHLQILALPAAGARTEQRLRRLRAPG